MPYVAQSRVLRSIDPIAGRNIGAAGLNILLRTVQ